MFNTCMVYRKSGDVELSSFSPRSKMLFSSFKYIKIKVFINTLINTQQIQLYLNTANLGL